jgi:hypothetical protein
MAWRQPSILISPSGAPTFDQDDIAGGAWAFTRRAFRHFENLRSIFFSIKMTCRHDEIWFLSNVFHLTNLATTTI